MKPKDVPIEINNFNIVRVIVSNFGWTVAGIYSLILEKCSRGNGFFEETYISREMIESELHFSSHEQRIAIELLVKEEFIFYRRGQGNRGYYSINIDKELSEQSRENA